MKRIIQVFLLVALISLAVGPVSAGKIKIVASTPDIKDMVLNICGDDVEVQSLMSGVENHHAVPLKPSFLVALSRCDVLIVNGLEYEHAFLPGALMSINNPDVKKGASHYIDTSKYIRPCEIPDKIDLSLGDLHPLGGPHIHIEPGNGILMCKVIYEEMIRLYPENKDKWKTAYETYIKRIYVKMKELQEYVKGTEGLKVVFYHPGWEYLTDRFGWKKVSYVESRAGIPPTPKHISQLTKTVRNENCKLLAIETCYSLKIPNYVAKKTGAKVISIPHHVNAMPGCETYIDFIDTLVRKIADIGREVSIEREGYGNGERKRQRKRKKRRQE